jgi:hypothetical protein
MIELRNNTLEFSFQDVHPEAKLEIGFQRTLRIPDDGKDYPLPPGLGRFSIKHVDDFANQSEALWLNFDPNYIEDHRTSYPFAIKVASGKINAVTGDSWTDWLQRSPQDYMVSSEQPWLDGYCVEKGFIRQFVAMPLGAGYSAEEQITDSGEHGGIQLVVYPIKRKVFERRFPKIKPIKIKKSLYSKFKFQLDLRSPVVPNMGLAPGGRMRQEIYEDPFDLDDWEMDNRSRCFVHIANSLVWRSITGETPPTVPFTAKEYTKFGLPWFDYYSDNSNPVKGSKKLEGLKSVVEMGKDRGEVPLPENESVTPENVVKLRSGLKKDQVREGSF